MQILTTIAAVRAARLALRAGGQTLGLVPTMGALHPGHLSLVRAARRASDAVAVSIFVNPTQFGPNEDFSRYPRSFEADCTLLEAEAVDFVFAPTADEMYPQGASTRVFVGAIANRLDGASRPGHFDGVATVVAKLLHIFEPEHAFFGQKDAAQAAVLRAMVRDLNFAVELSVCPTVREPDGLAMSSRNRYLSPPDRERALMLSRARAGVEARVAQGETRAAVLIETVRAMLAGDDSLSRIPGDLGSAGGSPGSALRVDYIAAVDPLTLEPVEEIAGETLFAVAAYLGQTRLIDNAVLHPAIQSATAT